MYKIAFLLSLTVLISASPQTFDRKHFKVGIEYERSLPMTGGSDRYKHRNNFDPFYVTVTASAKKNYVISYMEVSTTTDADGDVVFSLVRGDTGSKSLVFQLVSNNTEFLSFSYMVYGIKEDEYKKVMNIITLPRNNSWRSECQFYSIVIVILLALEKECPQDEVHKSCSFYEEYTCWETPELNKRVKTTPKRLTHCRSGCFCNKGFVRSYPEGKCITELTCRDQELLATMRKIPNKTFDF
ncbi:hypothetical protein KGM_205967 [Danaus plexippus plexippus]|uniref:TIL domain-containing protein n=1 Tax=Danaus plexippus plexippus TaxID=278856 RepID=A0A212FD36_DANPL|nr:hypothetical protein KGM_205967 [Danaus plexippus plexippus]